MEKIFQGKKILITSGPVWVPIDKVRIITSIFGGALGVIMAKEAEEMGADVLLLMGPGRAKIENTKNLKVIKFKYFDELFSLLKKEVSSKKYDIVIHSSAVPDYVPEKVFNGKIKSGKENFTIKLKPTVKIIDYIKKWDPSVLLVKFKLEVDKKEKDLIDIAKKSMLKSNADIIVANDLYKMTKDKQPAFIIENDQIKSVFTKENIAKELFKIISQCKK